MSSSGDRTFVIRVRVPYGQKVTRVLCGEGFSSYTCAIEAIHPASDRVEDLETAVAERDPAVDPICVLQGQIDELRQRVEERASADDRVLANHNERLRNLQDRIVALELGLELMHRHGYPVPNQPKRIIKGGWLNIYWSEQHHRSMVGAFCSTKEEADRADQGDRRIACIQIPDITEGEGL